MLKDSNQGHVKRREFVRSGMLSAGAVFVGLDRFCLPGTRLDQDAFRNGKLLETLGFVHEGSAPAEIPEGSELDGRLFTDLNSLNTENPITAQQKFYVRTRASKLLPDAKTWMIKVDGLVEEPLTLPINDLRELAKPAGLHLMECAGNMRFARFGMISVGRWSGVPLADILARTRPQASARRVLINGFDRYESTSASSIAGASWVFSFEEAKASGAFLATELNGEPLRADHGAPVRLVVPGWYGCTCLKWVDAITLVDDDAEATSQMKEYAARTHQKGVPALAKEYEPAVIDQAAMPVRVEKWLVDRKIKYRVVGILWGGTQIVKTLQIRFNPEEDYVRVDHFSQEQNDPWSFWTHAWSPKSPGAYSIRLMVKDPPVRTRRLDSGYYVRTVEISEV